MEAWLPIRGFDGYSVSTHGRIRSDKSGGAILKPSINKDGYQRIGLYVRGMGKKTVNVHRVVAEHFVEGWAPDLETRHRDGNPSNNFVENLRWGTHSENTLDKVSHGTHTQAAKRSCPSGHEYSADNTYQWNGTRACRKCRSSVRAKRKLAAA
ncbi:HNH endonuclease [Gordonia phage SpeedDemon]|nr:HNH endonuclease [Gordonia phage SpeedDemon]